MKITDEKFKNNDELRNDTKTYLIENAEKEKKKIDDEQKNLFDKLDAEAKKQEESEKITQDNVKKIEN